MEACFGPFAGGFLAATRLPPSSEAFRVGLGAVAGIMRVNFRPFFAMVAGGRGARSLAVIARELAG